MALFTLLQAAGEAVANTAAQAVAATENMAANAQSVANEMASTADQQAQQAQQGGSPWTMWIMLGLIFVVMYFFMIRPQKKQQKELQRFRDSLAKGDKVVTIGGIFGTVVEIKEESVLIEVDNGVKIRVSKQALVKDFSDPSRQ